ncbi:MAG: RNA methyltransferase [Acidimicrobiales bacterium]
MGRRSARYSERAFVVEGPTLLAEAVAAGLTIEEVFRGPSASLDLPTGVPVRDIDDRVINAVTDVESPRGVLAVVAMPARALPSDASFVVVLAGVADPGNAGTIIRSAEAAGADGIVLTAGSVDPYNPKCVRASAGALFHVPVIVDGDPRALGLRSIGTSSHAPTSYLDADLRRPLALVFGNEAHGIPDGIDLDVVVSIPHRGRTESLNVAMAATLLCFEVARRPQ